MKKKWVVPGIIVLLLGLAAVLLTNSGGDVRNVERLDAESTLYSDEDIDQAMDIAIKSFSQGFEDCKLLNITYDEKETLAEIGRQRDRYGELKLIVLVSSFYAGEKAAGGFEPDMTYTGWKWILRDNGNGWEMVTWGYA